MVAEYASSDLEKAGRFWPGHPNVTLNRALAGIAGAAAAGESPGETLVASGIATSRKAPLAAGPFLIRGAQAQLAGNRPAAERSFLEARRRDPRAPATRYFLAEYYLQAGRIGEGLQELSVLANLVPGGANNLAPFLATFARTKGASAQLRQLFHSDPHLEASVLGELAKDVGNARLILSIASPRAFAQDRRGEWLPSLLDGLVGKGDFAAAHQLWRRASGVRSHQGIFDPAFQGNPAPPPFNWNLAAGGVGFAEPTGDGGLRAIFYGRDNAVLASQTLLLRPGRYRLSMKASGSRDSASLIRWSITCLPSGTQLLSLPLSVNPGETLSGSFEVPQGCRAQRLELVGTAPEFPQQADVIVSDLQLAGPGG